MQAGVLEESNKMADRPEEVEPKLKLNIKSTRNKDTVEVSPDCTVRQVGEF